MMDMIQKFSSIKYGDNADLYSLVIEPDEKNLDLVKQNLVEFQEHIKIIGKAVWDEETVLPFMSGGGEGSGLNDSGDTVVESISLDRIYELYPECLRGRTTIVKMDIEGTELKALKGGCDFILKEKPILVVCLYHKPEDIIEIPEYIFKLNPSYKLYLRRYRYAESFRDTVLYALPE